MGTVLDFAALVTGILILIWQARVRKLDTDGMALIAVFGTVAGLLGAKISELVFQGWPIRVSFFTLFDPSAGGRALLGGVIFGWFAVVWAKHRMGIRRSTGDLFALALPAGEAVGRIGCFFNGCCYGTEYSGPLAVFQHGAWRHPAQLYSAVVAAAIFGALFAVDRTHRLREGDLFRLYLLLFGIGRFGLEFLRANDTYWAGLTPMQWFCLELVLFASIAFAWRRKPVIAA